MYVTHTSSPINLGIKSRILNFGTLEYDITNYTYCNEVDNLMHPKFKLSYIRDVLN